MIKQVFQRTGERSAIHRARDDEAVRRAHALNDRRRIIIVLFGWPAVGERNFLVGEVDQLDLEVFPRRTRGIEQPSRRVEQPSRRRDASYNRQQSRRHEVLYPAIRPANATLSCPSRLATSLRTSGINSRP